MTIEFKKASKKNARLRLALMGASGSGKTFSALEIAKGLGSKIALIDTEHESASKYADQFSFDTLALDDFDPDHYVKAIEAAEDAGYEVVIIDSLTHAWSGTGGILDQKDRAGGDSFGAWRKLTPKHNALVDAIVRSKIHVIATMRAKQSYEVEKDEKGKNSVKKLGLGAVQRDGMEYEFDVVAMMDESVMTITKTRYSKITGKAIRQPGEKFGRELAEWLSDGAPTEVTPAPIAVLRAQIAAAPTLDALGTLWKATPAGPVKTALTAEKDARKAALSAPPAAAPAPVSAPPAPAPVEKPVTPPPAAPAASSKEEGEDF